MKRKQAHRRNESLRMTDLYPKRKDGLCRCGCGEALAGRQRDWRAGHSAKCVEDFLIQKGDTTAIRRAVFRRDKGVCGICKRDAEALRKAVHLYPDPDQLRPHRSTREQRARLEAAFADARDLARLEAFRLGFPSTSRSFWEADHIKPLILGGTHALDNLRTLCWPCHKRATADLARQRAEERRRVDARASLASIDAKLGFALTPGPRTGKGAPQT